mmetsp:Transcript_30189/g.70455  ORF Transcript_30189/g.70455 Transcript_30189/m.70455 type:complete len:284 (+) Transcript_30189:73-924(+)
MGGISGKSSSSGDPKGKKSSGKKGKAAVPSSPSNGHIVASASEAAGVVVCFDWDCTITSRHMYKAFAGGQWSEVHSKPFEEWCKRNQIPNPMSVKLQRSIIDRMFVTEARGEEYLRQAFREYFLGGEARIQMLTQLFQSLLEEKCVLCILTRGDASSLRLCFDKAIPEWSTLFSSGWIGDTSGEYFRSDSKGQLSPARDGLHSGRNEQQKEAILEEHFPFTTNKVILVDDSIIPNSTKTNTIKTRDGRKGGLIHLLDLPTEKLGINEESSDMLLGLVRQLNGT